jgi:hypothetical protein
MAEQDPKQSAQQQQQVQRQQQQAPPRGPGEGPFDREINLRAISIFGVVLTASIVLAALLMFFMFQFFQDRDTAGDAADSPLVDHSIQRLPPEPRLQASPPVDLETMRAEEDAVLEHYGWVDEQRRVARIPIERAIALMAAAAGDPAAWDDGDRDDAGSGDARGHDGHGGGH